MPDAHAVTIADAVAYELNEVDWTPHSFTAERSWADWELMLDEAGVLHVDVVPASVSQGAEQWGNGKWKYKCPVDIAVRYRFGSGNRDTADGRLELDEVDPYVKLLQDIAEMFMPQQPSQGIRPLSQVQLATWEATTIRVLCDKAHLRKSMYLGVIRVTFNLEVSA